MRGKLEKQGQYELFETTHGHQILTLGHKNWYAVVEGQQSDLLVGSDSDHQKKKTIWQGDYYLADFEDDPQFKDMPHLFMQDGKQFHEFVLPNDLPQEKGDQVRLIRTDKKLSEDKVMQHVKGKGNKGNEKQYNGQPESLRTKTKSELYDIAKKQAIHGRSKMNKAELVKKLAQKMSGAR